MNKALLRKILVMTIIWLITILYGVGEGFLFYYGWLEFNESVVKISCAALLLIPFAVCLIVAIASLFTKAKSFVIETKDSKYYVRLYSGIYTTIFYDNDIIVDKACGLRNVRMLHGEGVDQPDEFYIWVGNWNKIDFWFNGKWIDVEKEKYFDFTQDEEPLKEYPTYLDLIEIKDLITCANWIVNSNEFKEETRKLFNEYDFTEDDRVFLSTIIEKQKPEEEFLIEYLTRKHFVA